MKKTIKLQFLQIVIILVGVLIHLKVSAIEYRWANPLPQGNIVNAMAYESSGEGLCVGDSGTCLYTDDFGQTWTNRMLFPHFTIDLFDVVNIGNNSYLAVGESPGIFRSDDMGQSWIPIENPSSGPLFDIYRINSTAISIAGSNGQVLHSNDNGTTWQIKSAPGVSDCWDQFWWNETQGFIVGVFTAVKTEDGGQTWTEIPDILSSLGGAMMTRIHFTDPLNGWILDHFNTFRTYDGGLSWVEKHGPILSAPIYQVDAVWHSTDHRTVIVGLEGAQIWETVDDGDNWTLLYERITTGGYMDIDQLPDGRLNVCSSDGDHLTSTDTGQSWTNYTTGPDDESRNFLETITFDNSNRAWAAGRANLWLKSDNSGETWHRYTSAPEIETTRVIEFLNHNYGLAGGYVPPGQSLMYRTTDGGETWTGHYFSGSFVGYPNDASIVTQDISYVVCWGGTEINKVFKSVDGGVNWTDKSGNLPENIPLYSIHFFDENTGYVAGGHFQATNNLWFTVDGGEIWEERSSELIENITINDMVWFNTQTGMIASLNGVFRTDDGGSSWTEVLTQACTSIHFIDSMTGIVTNNSSPIVHFTQDGGQTWFPISYPWTGRPHDAALTPDGIFVCGAGSVILNVIGADECLNNGDVNLDNEITAGDAQIAFQIALGSYQPTIVEECASDCNADDDVTAGDAQQIFLVALGADNCLDPIGLVTG